MKPSCRYQTSAMLTKPPPETPNKLGYADDDSENAEEDGIDDITKFFAALINSPPDTETSKHRLDMLHEHSPSGFQGQSPQGQSLRRQEHRTRSTFLDVLEVDGDGSYDLADETSVDETMPRKRSEVELNGAEAEEQHHIDSVAKRLAVIADRMVIEKMFKMSGVKGEHGQLNVSIPYIGVANDILAAKSYNSFKQIVIRELANTHGWEQVAWYTYLIRTAVYIADPIQHLGTIAYKRAKQFFSSDLRPWIVSRPLGWESLHEETDIESS